MRWGRASRAPAALVSAGGNAGCRARVCMGHKCCRLFSSPESREGQRAGLSQARFVIACAKIENPRSPAVCPLLSLPQVLLHYRAGPLQRAGGVGVPCSALGQVLNGCQLGQMHLVRPGD